MRGENDIPPLVTTADSLEERVERNDREGVQQTEAGVSIIH